MRVWEKFLNQQEKEIGREVVERWLRPLRIVRFDACNLYLEAKDSFHVMWFEEHMKLKVRSNLFNNNNNRIKVHLSVAAKKAVSKKPENTKNSFFKKGHERFFIHLDELDPGMSFKNFVVTEGNHLAYKLLHQASSLSKESEVSLGLFNPIYLYGETGSGKTHLMMSAAAELKKQGLNVIYSRAETFTDHVVFAIRAGEMHTFRETYRKSDILFLDDVHLFSRKKATQEEFFHTFNTLHVAGVQIVLSANCSPQELQMIEPRLVSRFEWGIVLALENNSSEMVQQLAEKKAEALDLNLSPKVVEFLVQKFKSGTKSIVKALEALALRAHLGHQKVRGQISLLDAENYLKDLIEEEEKVVLTPDRIVQGVAEFYGIKSEDILGDAQSREFALPRQVSMYICRHQLKMPYIQIGRTFSRNHSTVISSIRNIQKWIDQNQKEMPSTIASINKKLQASLLIK